jgi:hypothetical protein
MKVLVASLAVCVLSSVPAPGLSQTVGVQTPAAIRSRTVQDSALTNALNNFELLGERDFRRESGLMVRLLTVPGESGSARDGESDQVVSWVYIAVSEHDELPRQRLYRVGPLFNPKVDSLVIRDSIPTAFLSYGTDRKRRKARIAASLERIRIADAGSNP